MVSTRTTAQSQRELQRLDCSVPWLLVVHILPPLWGAGAILGAAGLEGAGRRRGLRQAGDHRQLRTHAGGDLY